MVTLLVTSLFLMGALFPEIRNKVTLFFDTEEPCRQKDYDLSADPALFVHLPEKLKEDLRNLRVSSFAQDTDSKIHKKLNAVFSPRV